MTPLTAQDQLVITGLLLLGGVCCWLGYVG
jgi:hypothetical protein